MDRYVVKARDEHNNTTIMGEHYTLADAEDDEEILRINNPMMYIWVEETHYWEEEDA